MLVGYDRPDGCAATPAGTSRAGVTNRKYRILTGVQYPPDENRRREPGEVVQDIPTWLGDVLERDGVIERVREHPDHDVDEPEAPTALTETPDGDVVLAHVDEATGKPDEAARWLLVEWRADGTIKYARSNLPPATTLEQAVCWWKERWQVERGYLQLKDELGLDHFEGRSWTGFHHHATMTFLAYGFLALERQHAHTALAADPAKPPGEAQRGA